MSTFARRLSLWKLLATSTEPLSLADLARRCGVSKNTAQRDLDALSAAGVGVVEERRGQRLYFSLAPGEWAPSAGHRSAARSERRR
ncbi:MULTISPECIES: winged helix-turn-helix domain-containing protein [unclassified Anaeromyxobacter]|uniref:winged helix-turn-helix domain-containing protein n=1 Tax=unclassified Anaeromyxobacter TaxID=2620896 RepID=UPI001F565EC0|nr:MULTISPECIES: winged helix-turn-helix domain-containing protein [unclassified Anaeromyxobacter]